MKREGDEFVRKRYCAGRIGKLSGVSGKVRSLTVARTYPVVG